MVHREGSTPEPRKNKLNELSGRDWIKFTKSWFVHRPEPRGDRKIRHPASFPESLVKDFVSFFTRKGELVVDPFVGTGSTLLAALETGRSGIGFEIVEKYAEISREWFPSGRLLHHVAPLLEPTEKESHEAEGSRRKRPRHSL